MLCACCLTRFVVIASPRWPGAEAVMASLLYHAQSLFAILRKAKALEESRLNSELQAAMNRADLSLFWKKLASGRGFYKQFRKRILTEKNCFGAGGIIAGSLPALFVRLHSSIR